MVCIGGNYDAVGHQTAFPLTLNGRSDRTISTEYDHLGNATSIRQHGNAVDEIFAEFEHNANGLLTSVRRYEKDDDTINEIANSLYEYNANSAVTSITHNDSNGSQIVKHSYTYDETNNIVEYLNSIDGNTEYNYDFLGQLISADYANGSIADETYTYDENGNRITANGDTYTTGDNNELTSDGTWTYTYDAEGNRISKTNSTNRELYTWDYRNRLTTVTKQTYDTLTNEWTTVQIVEYAYDYNNIWIRKTLDTNGDGIADSKTIFIPENYQTTVQIDNNTVTHHYLWTPNQQDKLLADTTTSGILWALTDHLGTIRDVLDGNSSTHLIYDAFGNLTSGTNPLLFGYTGKPFDADTALQNNINRWYDATIGRWLSTDPIGFHGNDMNLYRYINNRLLYSLDFSGLQECTIFLYIADNEELWEMLYEDKFLTIPKPEEGKRYDLDKRKPIEESVFPSPYQNEWSSSIDEYTFFDIITCWSKPFLRGAPPEHLILPTRKRLPMDKGMLPGEFILDRVELLKKVIPQTMKKKKCLSYCIKYKCGPMAIEKMEETIKLWEERIDMLRQDIYRCQNQIKTNSPEIRSIGIPTNRQCSDRIRIDKGMIEKWKSRIISLREIIEKCNL